MNATYRAWLASFIAAVVVLLVVWSMPSYLIVPCGIVLPTNGIKTATSGEITLYSEANTPTTANSIGILNLMYYTKSNDFFAQQNVARAITRLVTAAGGNAVQLIQSFYVPPGSPSGGVNIFKGRVILTK